VHSEFLTLAAMLLAALVVLVGAVVWTMAKLLLHPERMSDPRAAYVLKRLSPADLGMRYEPQQFTVHDEAEGAGGAPLSLASWWIPCPRPRSATRHWDRTVVLIHGYSDAKVGVIAWAPTWHALGYHVLALDLRAHGESDGAYSTSGYHERHDLNQVINQLRSQRADETRHLVLFGISLGASVALAAMAIRETPEDVEAVVLECPYAEYPHAVLAHAAQMNMPGRTLQPLAIRLAGWMSGAHFDEVAPVKTILKAPCPVMLIQGGCDVFVTESDMRAMEAALAQRSDPRSVYWRVEEAGHVTGICADPEEYRQRIKAFLEGAEATSSEPRELVAQDSSATR
jgi:pimeloyl-ACP methyl ester carboxylesterase